MMTTSAQSIDRLAAGLGFVAGDPAPGTALGRYAVLRHLGAGASANVYGAYDPDLDREIALKVLDAGASALDLEVHAMARVAHPNVVSLYDAGLCDGRAFVAMELVDGASLRDVVRDGGSPWQLLGLFEQLARGLHAVHLAGLVHRDVKPDNVLVDAIGRVRLADFGLVARAGHRSANPAGTPAYMAPECFDGAPAEASADQFAFAVALFEVLTGRRPFAGRTVLALQTNMRAGRIGGGWSRVPKPIRAILRRALDPVPARRFGTMADVADALTDAVESSRGAADTGVARGHHGEQTWSRGDDAGVIGAGR